MNLCSVKKNLNIEIGTAADIHFLSIKHFVEILLPQLANPAITISPDILAVIRTLALADTRTRMLSSTMNATRVTRSSRAGV